MSSLFAFLSSHPQLSIIQHKKSWLVHLDALVLSADGGNLYDALIVAARAALWDLKIPRTRGIGYNAAPVGPAEDDEAPERDVDMVGFSALLKGGKRGKGNEIDFELESYWDEGDPLQDRELLPVSVTLNLVRYLAQSTKFVNGAGPGRWTKRLS
jgi:exosome complex component RRP42